jgi:hypothetical protein
MELQHVKALVEQDNEGVEVKIEMPNGDFYLGADGNPSTFTVLGSESVKYKEARRAQQRRIFKRARQGGGATMTPEESERDAIELAASAVIGFSGWEADGEPLPFTPENVKALLAVDHIFDQVNRAIQRHASFFERASAN